MRSPTFRDRTWLKSIPASTTVLQVTGSVRARASAEFLFPLIDDLQHIPPGTEALVVAGGGVLMDEAKYFRARLRPEIHLILMPSIWGSGAECSPIAVLNRNGAKEIVKGDDYLPDTVVYWPELLSTVTDTQARRACGDTWAHTVEAFFSPLANDDLRSELAALLREMLRLPLAVVPRWFHASARASALQARASVGLVHGIAHVVEGPCHTHRPGEQWGHTRLCSTFLLPVMNINRQASRWTDLTRQYNLDETALWSVFENLFEPDTFLTAIPIIKENWMKILRDPCTRMNGTLVRPGHLEEMQCQVAA